MVLAERTHTGIALPRGPARVLAPGKGGPVPSPHPQVPPGQRRGWGSFRGAEEGWRMKSLEVLRSDVIFWLLGQDLSEHRRTEWR